MKWFIYILLCSDGTFYTSITTNLSKRIVEHNSSRKGAKYTRTRRPVTLAYSEEARNRSKAAKREYRIKKLKRKEKEKLCETYL
jgi:putative endonuclease